MTKESHPPLFKGMMLVAGTSIGGGMLALPVLTSQAGFFPALAVYLLCWLFMACTGILLLEACAAHHPGANMISLAVRTLGPWGKWVAWVLYLFLFYSLTIAYISGCGHLVVVASGGIIPEWLGEVLFVLIFGPAIYFGAKLVGKINAILVAGLALSYLAFVVAGIPHINFERLTYSNWQFFPLALPIAFTAFAYQGTVPTLFNYMHRNVKLTRLAILIGSFIPFVIYAIWQGLILGIVPMQGLVEAIHRGESAVEPLKAVLNHPYIYVIGQALAFFALVTSFFGVTLGLCDFLMDGLNLKHRFPERFFTCMLVFIPPLLFAMTHPGVFLIALDYAGGFGCALLLGVLPILIVWSGRYRMKIFYQPLLPGGRTALSLLLLFVAVELSSQIFILLKHWL